MELLKIERGLGLHLFDVKSGHPGYSWSDAYPGDSFERTEDFLFRAEEFDDDRPFWNTESDTKDSGITGDYVAWYVEARRRFGDRIRAHFRLAPWAYFVGGEQAWNAGQFTPNQQYRDMQRVIAGETTKRRAVRS